MFSIKHLWPCSKSKFNLKADRVNLVAPSIIVLLSVCLIYPMSGRYSTNLDRKSWPGSEIQMYYYCCPCYVSKFVLTSKTGLATELRLETAYRSTYEINLDVLLNSNSVSTQTKFCFNQTEFFKVSEIIVNNDMISSYAFFLGSKVQSSTAWSRRSTQLCNPYPSTSISSSTISLWLAA